MNVKNKLGKVGASVLILVFLFSVSAGLMPSTTCGSEAASDTFTHSVFAEFGTATW